MIILIRTYNANVVCKIYYSILFRSCDLYIIVYMFTRIFRDKIKKILILFFTDFPVFQAIYFLCFATLQ